MNMRTILPLLLAIVFGIAVPARAQIFQITASGTITVAEGSFSDVPPGTPFSFTETFDSATAALISSTATSATYADPAGSSSFSFDGFNYSGSGPQITITSNVPNTNPPDGIYIYGYEFSQPLSGGEGYAVQLLSIDQSVAPSTSLDNLHTFPVSDFFSGIGNLVNVNEDSGNASGVVTTSFSVVESVPEPSSFALFAFAVPLLWWRRSRQQRECVAA
jgi:hypothetical protein